MAATVCPLCGQQHPAEARFCPVTGVALEPTAFPSSHVWQNAPVAVARRSPSSRLLPALFILLGVVGLGLIAIGVWASHAGTFSLGSPRRVASPVFTQTTNVEPTPQPSATESAVVIPATATNPPRPTPLPPTANPPTTAPTAAALPSPPRYPAASLRGHIVFTCFDGNDDEICLMNADGSGLAQLTNNSVGDFYPSLSGDGRRILFARQIDGSNYEIFRMNTDGAGETQLTLNGGGNFAPAYSPDDSLIAFTSTQGGGTQHIWVMGSDGSSQRQLTTEGVNADPSWSPDGRAIAFASSRSGKTRIWVMNSDGSSARPISRDNDIGGRNAWSPDGRMLAYYAGKRDDGSRNIYVVSIDSGDALQLTFEGDNLAPSFSPDGGWIAFTSHRDGDNDIYVMRPDGSNVINLTQNSGSDYQPRWGP